MVGFCPAIFAVFNWSSVGESNLFLIYVYDYTGTLFVAQQPQQRRAIDAWALATISSISSCNLFDLRLLPPRRSFS
jgi:hypothetical protein